MSIEIASLKKMIVLEAKASIAWKALSSVEQSAYITANPGSKFAALASNDVTVNTKSATHNALESSGYRRSLPSHTAGGITRTKYVPVSTASKPVNALHKNLSAAGYKKSSEGMKAGAKHYRHPEGHEVHVHDNGNVSHVY